MNNVEQAPEGKTTTLSNLKTLGGAESLPPVRVGLNDLQGFELAQRAAKLLASSTLVPKEYQGNISNCTVALNMSARIGADPLMVMQNLVVVHGKPTWSSQFLIATVNTCGRFTSLRFEFFGEKGKDSWGCRAWAEEKSTGEKLVGTDVTMKIAKDEGWHGRKGSKWQTMPQQMLMYRAAAWWARAYAPEISMGLHTNDEANDSYIDAVQQPDGSYAVSTEDLKSDSIEIVESSAKEAVEETAATEPEVITQEPELVEAVRQTEDPLGDIPAQFR